MANILIVEDETIVALDIKKTLEKFNHTTYTAFNHNTAMKYIKEYPIDLVFMDINLKDSCKDGIETTKDIKELQNTHIIYITAYNDIHTIQRVIQTNPIGYLTKPFNREKIKILLNSISF